MKKYALLLPQFYETPENNKWWGEGFTEWSNVKKAKPLYKGHNQPKEPLNNNYYNLLDIDTVKWQTSLMKEYNIDGFIYYHYYFEGKMLLQKPAENLLNNKEINQPFFFCWANHSWDRSWENSREMLIEQTYGNVEDWEKHFQYLLPFFKDERYIKKDNMPMFMIYQSDFDCRDEMFEYFNNRCIKEGFEGLYLIETFLDGGYSWPSDYQNKINNLSKYTKKLYLREPNTSLDIYNSVAKYKPIRMARKIVRVIKSILRISTVPTYSTDTLYNLIIEKEPKNNKVVHGVFFEWDNTPRYGERGFVINNVTKKSFDKIMDYFKNDDFIVINAWNEWSEGMMLEPTKENNYKYLEWLKNDSEKE